MGYRNMTFRLRGNAFRGAGKCSMFGLGGWLRDTCGFCFGGLPQLGVDCEEVLL